MSRRDKERQLEGQKNMMRREEEASTPTLADKYPHIRQVWLSYVVHDDSGNVVVREAKRHRLGMSTTKLLRYPCGNAECTSRELDISAILADLVRSGERTRTGREVCRGWQDRERINKFTCLTDIVATFEVEYQSDPVLEIDNSSADDDGGAAN